MSDRSSTKSLRFLVVVAVFSGGVFGPPMDLARALSYVYVQQGSALTYREGTSQPDPLWTDPDHTLGAEWIDSAPGFGIGYGDGDDSTVLDTMQNNYVTVYVRSTFTVGAEIGTLTHLELNVLFDDGFVAYLNGVEIGRSAVPAGPLSFDTTANAGHEASDGEETFTVDPSLLLPGDNVFAVEAHNVDLGSSDLSFLPTLWGYDSPPLDAEITVGPYLQRLGRRSVLVCWETDLPAPSAVSIGVGAIPDQLLEDLTERTRHELEITGLAPATPYSYRVDSARVPSAVGLIHTETDAASPYRFVIFGDTRSNHDDHRSVVDRIIVEAPAFMLHTGDLVSDGTSEGDWATFFDVEEGLVRDVTLYPTLGNHEADGARYLELFAPPDDLAPGTENYYAFTFATTAVLMLDLYLSDFGPGSAQYTWLEDTLQAFVQDPSIHLRLVALHHGPYDSGSHGSNLGVRDDLTPLFETYGVDAVFSGHDHMYERSTVNGIKYVVTGGGGAPLYSVPGDWWTEESESVLHYVVLDVEGPRAEVVVKRLDDTVLDQFVLNDALADCASAVDCESLPVGACEPDEEGDWACIQGGCVWNCVIEQTALPDAGVIPGPDANVIPDPDAGTTPSDDPGGCGCRQTSPGPGSGVPLIPWLVLGLAFWRIRRRWRRRFRCRRR